MNRDEFAELTDKEFILRADGGTELKLELVDVSELKTMESHEEFSLVFLAPPKINVEPFTYTLVHSSLGELELFLSPFSSDENGLKLEAAFCMEH